MRELLIRYKISYIRYTRDSSQYRLYNITYKSILS